MFKKRTPNVEQRKALGRLIRDARKRTGLTQERLAEHTECCHNWINKIECGESNPNWLDILRLVVILELDPAEILEEVGVHVSIPSG